MQALRYEAIFLVPCSAEFMGNDVQGEAGTAGCPEIQLRYRFSTEGLGGI